MIALLIPQGVLGDPLAWSIVATAEVFSNVRGGLGMRVDVAF